MNPTLFYLILGVILFLCIYALYNLIGSCEEKTPLPTNDLTDEQKKQLSLLNDKVDHLQKLLSKKDNEITDTLTQKDYLKNELSSKERVLNLKDIEIKRLRNELGKQVVNLDFSLKVGDKVSGRKLPNSSKYVSGTIISVTRRGNFRLDNGSTISHVDAKLIL